MLGFIFFIDFITYSSLPFLRKTASYFLRLISFSLKGPAGIKCPMITFSFNPYWRFAHTYDTFLKVENPSNTGGSVIISSSEYWVVAAPPLNAVTVTLYVPAPS